jgi:hypothetical protein
MFQGKQDNFAVSMVLQAVMGTGKEGGFAVDDLTIEQKSCESKCMHIISFCTV